MHFVQSLALTLLFAGCATAQPAASPLDTTSTMAVTAADLVDAVLADPALRDRLAAALKPATSPTERPVTLPVETIRELRTLRLEVDALKAAVRAAQPPADGEAVPGAPVRLDPGADDVLERWIRRIDRDQDLLERQLRRLEQRLSRLERQPVRP